MHFSPPHLKTCLRPGSMVPHFRHIAAMRTSRVCFISWGSIPQQAVVLLATAAQDDQLCYSLICWQALALLWDTLPICWNLILVSIKSVSDNNREHPSKKWLLLRQLSSSRFECLTAELGCANRSIINVWKNNLIGDPKRIFPVILKAKDVTRSGVVCQTSCKC